MATAKRGRRSKWSELDPRRLSSEAKTVKAGVEARLGGQAHATEAVTTFYQIWTSGLSDPNRPIGSFLFLGPTGTGKTRLVEALAEVLFHDRRALLKIPSLNPLGRALFRTRTSVIFTRLHSVHARTGDAVEPGVFERREGVG